MTDVQRSALLLIKSAVTGQPVTLPESVRLADVANLMRQSGMIALFYYGAENSGLLENAKFLEALTDIICVETFLSDRQLETLEQLYAALEENGIQYMPLKGALMKYIYPRPEMRTMSDADILIHSQDRQVLAQVMESLGYSPLSESDHEWNWTNDAIKVELHKRLVSSDDREYYRYFGDGWQWAKTNTGCRWAMAAEDTFIFDFTHFTKHYCKSGVNVRHIVDLWLHTTKNPDLNMAYIRNQLSQMRLEVFFDHVMAMMRAWFEDGAWDPRLEFMTDYIFSGGVSKAVSEQVRAGSGKKGKLQVLLHKLFPGRKHLDWNYPSLKKVPLPFAWVARWFMLLTSRKENARETSEKMKSVSTESVKAHAQGLEYVGLQFPDQ